MSNSLTEKFRKRLELSERLAKLIPEIMLVQEEITELDKEITPQLIAMNNMVKILSGSDPVPITRSIDIGNTPLHRQTAIKHPDYPRAIASTKKRESKLSVLEPPVIELITSAGRPMKTAELHAGIVKLGINVGGQNPISNLSAHLSHSERIVSTANGWDVRQPDLANPGTKNLGGNSQH
jgi:hypothetical protein